MLQIMESFFLCQNQINNIRQTNGKYLQIRNQTGPKCVFTNNGMRTSLSTPAHILTCINTYYNHPEETIKIIHRIFEFSCVGSPFCQFCHLFDVKICNNNPLRAMPKSIHASPRFVNPIIIPRYITKCSSTNNSIDILLIYQNKIIRDISVAINPSIP